MIEAIVEYWGFCNKKQQTIAQHTSEVFERTCLARQLVVAIEAKIVDQFKVQSTMGERKLQQSVERCDATRLN